MLQMFDKIQMMMVLTKNVAFKQPHIAIEQEMLHILTIVVSQIIHACILNLK